MYAQDSIELLRHSGIDFSAHATRGIDVRRFGELLLVSGVVLMPEVRWITFHSRRVDELYLCQGTGHLTRFVAFQLRLWVLAQALHLPAAARH